jgi:MYXO-CTERM domain-containing protein
VAASFALAGALATVSSHAAAFCRTTTCKLQPAAPFDACLPADFVGECAALDPPEKAFVLFWRNHCVSYDLHGDPQGDVSPRLGISYATASQIVADAFSRWTAVECPTSAGGNARVSVDAHDLGPVACDEVHYNSDQGNQHVIVFEDNGFDATDGTAAGGGPVGAETLGLTTMTFDADTGEIYDADMQINSQQQLATGDSIPLDAYDLDGIVTHEAGHFLGLAHSTLPSTTMYYSASPGSTSKRALTDDDMAGICTIYPPDGTRSVDPSVSASGFVTAETCDFTPRHGFQSVCSSPQSHGCAVANEPSSAVVSPLGIAIAASAAAAARRRRRRQFATAHVHSRVRS